MISQHPLLASLLGTHRTHTRQQSSYGRDPHRGGEWLQIRPAVARNKRILLQPGETFTMATIEGAGMITRLWMTTLRSINRNAFHDLVLRFYWDGEKEPSVECPFGAFFGAPFGRYVEYATDVLGLTSGGFLCNWPMPFASKAVLTVQNEGRRRVDPLFFQVTYQSSPEGVDTDHRFHAQWRRENPTVPGTPYTILDVRGKGHFVGCHLFMQNRHWWLKPNLLRAIFPYGFGLGMLEGPERIWVDGEQEPSVVGTGTEDYFNCGWYFMHGRSCGTNSGCTVRDYLRARAAAYRFDVASPMSFTRSLRMTFDHGIDNTVTTDYSSVAYWYQPEPHEASSPFPPAAERRPTSAGRNIVQSLLSLGAPLLVGLIVRWPPRG